MSKTRKWATDHRGVVLESVATNPVTTLDNIKADCIGPDFTATNISKMVWQLRREGLIGRDDNNQYFITKAGFDYLTRGRFDRALPAPHTRERGRRKTNK